MNKSVRTNRAASFLNALCVLLTFIIVPLYGFKVWQKHDYTDFSVYYRAAQRAAAHNWEHVYDLADGASPFRYMPFFLTLFRPFAGLTLQIAQLSWYFLQVACFIGGFWFLYQCLRMIRKTRSHALWVTCTSALFILRFCLDTFTIGQVSSLMFLGFAGALYGWMRSRGCLAGAALAIPTLFKIGPGFTFLLFGAVGRRPEFRKKSWLAAAGTFIALNVLLAAWVRPFAALRELWRNWLHIVAMDSVYYDASHYGSQSLKSVLLRLASSGFLSHSEVSALLLTISLAGCAGVFVLWILRKPSSVLGRGFFFSLGIFPYLWFMPETFKYSLTVLAFPVAFLFLAIVDGTRGKSVRFEKFALAFACVTLSLAGKDLMPNGLFFGLQKASIPFLATVFLGMAILRQTLRYSRPSRLALTIRSVFSGPTVEPWPHLPVSDPTVQVSLLIPVRLEAEPAVQRSAERAQKLARDWVRSTRSHWAGSSEIIFIPFGDRISDAHPTLQAIREAIHTEGQSQQIRILPPPKVDGRGSALRDAFLESRGQRILTGHFEQPCEFSFFTQAVSTMEAQPRLQLVRANRRDPNSRFKVPVSLLPVVYGRHRMGLFFNRLVRAVLPLSTTDTHSGTAALTRKLAEQVFLFQTSPDFLFDLELSLVAYAHGCQSLDLPCVLYLAQEKSVSRMLNETVAILIGLPMLASRFRKGYYGPALKLRAAAVSADDWGISPAVNAGILDLARKGIVHRVALMADCRYLNEGLAELKAVPGIRLGLHFNLTYGKKYAGPGKLLLDWINPFKNRGRLRHEVCQQLELQLQKLKKAGVTPEYLDGHHHIHVLPGFLALVSDTLKQAGIREIRLPYDPRLWFTAKAPLLVLALLAKKPIRESGFSTSPFFYPLSHDFRDQGFLRSKLTHASNLEIIVHPANRADPENWEFADPYVEGRVTEYRALQMVLIGGPQ